MIYLKASVRGSAGKAIAGMFFPRTMLEMPTLKDDNTSSLRTFVNNAHNIVRTLKSYGANLKAAAEHADGH